MTRNVALLLIQLFAATFLLLSNVNYVYFVVNAATVSSSEALFSAESKQPIVPNIIHQMYDYQSPNFFLYLSILCVQRYAKPDRHILWVNDEGRYRKGFWEHWQASAQEGTWEKNFTNLLSSGKVEWQYITYPASPPGNSSTWAPEKAHRSDFARMDVLKRMGGIYLDTDAFVIGAFTDTDLLSHEFTLSFDNIVNPDRTAPLRFNNGVILSAPNASFLNVWMKEYAKFNPKSFDYDSSVVPARLAWEYPDLIHLEMSRLSPISFAFQTSTLAEAMTCGIFMKPSPSSSSITTSTSTTATTTTTVKGAIWHPRWSGEHRSFTYAGTEPDEYMYRAVSQKLVLHLTMSAVRGICMMRKTLNSPQDLEVMPSLLGRVLRIALYGHDSFDYEPLLRAPEEEKLSAWKKCRDAMGMHATYDADDKSRQQYQQLFIQ